MQDNISRFPSRSTSEAEQTSNGVYVRLHNLPAQLTPLIGREREVENVSTLIRCPEVRLLTLTGPGGVGKTRLGLHIAEALRYDFADGVSFIPLAPISDPKLVISTIAQNFDLKESPDWSPLDHLKAYLHKKHCLLVLDNFEQVLPAAPLLIELLQTCPNVKILVSSRAVLHVSGEYEFPVPPLAVPDLKHIPTDEALSGYAAVNLFVQRARAIKQDFKLTEANVRTIAEICVRLDGLPLAIELAAARIKLLSPQALLNRLNPRLHVLTGGVRDAPSRQQTLRNAIAWSYDLLSPEEQRLFRRLSVFVGGFTLEAAEAAGNAKNDLRMDVLEGIASLVDKSLLQQTEWEAEEPRFTMLETIREYGLEALDVFGEIECIRQAHALYYLRLAEQAEPMLWGGPEQTRWMQWLEQEHDNLRAALRRLLERAEASENEANIELALRMGVSLREFWMSHGHYQEGRAFLERILVRSEDIKVSLRAKLLLAAESLAIYQGDFDRAEALCKESLALYQKLGDRRGMAYALYHRGGICWLRGDLLTALVHMEEALELRREVGDKKDIAWSLYYLANVASDQGEYSRARALFEESLALHKEVGNIAGRALALLCLAWVVFLSQGDAAEVNVLLEEGIALRMELGEKEGSVNSLLLSGELALSQGELAKARALAEESVTLTKEMGNRLDMAQSLAFLAKVLDRQDDLAMASVLYLESLKLLQEVGNKKMVPSCLEGLGAVVAKQGRAEWAVQLWGAADALRKVLGTPLPPVERTSYEQVVASARAQLGKEVFATAWVKGRTMTPEQALAGQGANPLGAHHSQAQKVFPTKTPLSYPAGLTAREMEVLRLVAQGMTNPQIAERLILSLYTVNAHVRSIYNKLEVNSRSALTRYAIERHLL